MARKGGGEGEQKVKSQRESLLLNYAITGTHHHSSSSSRDHYCRLEAAAAGKETQPRASERERERLGKIKRSTTKWKRRRRRRIKKKENKNCPSTNQNSQRTNKAKNEARHLPFGRQQMVSIKRENYSKCPLDSKSSADQLDKGALKRSSSSLAFF